jgi:GNAT superfamily N-acetyltransferase
VNGLFGTDHQPPNELPRDKELLKIRLHEGSRDALQPLFAEADDSDSEIASYRELGDILIASLDGEIVGQAQVVRLDGADYEIKSLAVYEPWRSRGVGAALVQAAGDYCRQRDGGLLIVATAAASVQALQFYQRQGFRIRRVIRDFYTAERGYRPLELNGIPLRDEIILDLDLREGPKVSA